MSLALEDVAKLSEEELFEEIRRQVSLARFNPAAYEVPANREVCREVARRLREEFNFRPFQPEL